LTETLPRWHDGVAKQAITDFVARVCGEGSPDFVPPPERIAVFDNDDAEREFAYDRSSAAGKLDRTRPAVLDTRSGRR